MFFTGIENLSDWVLNYKYLTEYRLGMRKRPVKSHSLHRAP